MSISHKWFVVGSAMVVVGSIMKLFDIEPTVFGYVLDQILILAWVGIANLTYIMGKNGRLD